MSVVATCQSRSSAPALCVGDRSMSFGERTYVMGVVNITPDSFSDGGQFLDPDAAIEHALSLVDQGADIIDIGGESTRPGATPVAADDELQRVVPVVEAVHRHSDAWISIDTYKADVAAEALKAGAHLVNDISGLGFDDRMASTVADAECGLVLMHIRKTPRDMQDEIRYEDVVGDIRSYFQQRTADARAAGIAAERIVLDPGIGFGKTVAHNYRLMRELSAFSDLGHALLIGTSRKSFIGAITDCPPEHRRWGTAATVACGIFAGADIVRVHDVAQMTKVARVAEAICDMKGPAAR